MRGRVAFLRAYLVASRQRSLWLAVSGGVDSALTGRLCSLAVTAANRDGGAFRFVAVRLPHGRQRDAADAQRVLKWIEPSEVVSVDIARAVGALEASLPRDHLEAGSETARDYARGNTKARMRMAVQYHLANLEGGLVVGTDHSAEALVGFFTKFGDGAADLCPLFGLSKRQVRRLASHLGAPEAIVAKQADRRPRGPAPGAAGRGGAGDQLPGDRRLPGGSAGSRGGRGPDRRAAPRHRAQAPYPGRAPGHLVAVVGAPASGRHGGLEGRKGAGPRIRMARRLGTPASGRHAARRAARAQG